MSTHVGFIGLGNMGGRIARRLLDAGVPVTGHDARADLSEELARIAVGSIAEAVAPADVVLLSLPDSTVVEAVIRGPGGVAESAREGQVVVDLSTAAPASTIALAEELAERGVTYIDAGVSGGAAAAERGALTIMAGGPEQVVTDLKPLLAHAATTIAHMGAVGTGHTAKLLNNFLNGISLAATAEVMVAARAAGLDLEVLLEVLNTSSGVNFATVERFPKIIHGDYLEGGLSSRLMMKDVLAYVECLRGLGVPSLNASGPVASFGAALHLGYGDQISNRVVDALGDMAGGVRLHDAEGGPS